MRSLVRPAVVVAGWLALAHVLAPWGLRLLCGGQAESGLGWYLRGRGRRTVEEVLATWDRLAVSATAVLGVLVTGWVALILLRRRPRVRAATDRAAARLASGGPSRLGDLLVLAGCLGLLAGVGELLAMSVRRTASDYPGMYYSDHAVWRTPLADTLLLLVAAVGLAGAFLVLPALRGRFAAVAALSAVGLLAVVRTLVPGIHVAAAAALSLGLGVRLAAFAVRDAGRWRRVLFRSTAVALAVIASGLAWRARDALAPTEAHAAEPASDRGQPPNVLVLMLDTVSARHLSLNGYARDTSPTLRRLAREGVAFDVAVSPSNWTLPAHASLFTGRWHHQQSANWKTPLDDVDPTLAEIFRRHGYGTFAAFGNLFFGAGHYGLQRGFEEVEVSPLTFPALLQDARLPRELAEWFQKGVRDKELLVRKSAPEVSGEFLDWLDEGRGERPFFAFLNYFDAHDPYLPPDPWLERFRAPEPRYWLKLGPRRYTEAEREELRAAYDGAIAYLDSEIDRLLGELTRRGVLGDTLVVVVSDHGEEFGGHSVMCHGNSLYMPLIQVPLVLWRPGLLPADRRVSRPVSTRDLGATLFDVLGLAEGRDFPGRSLRPLWEPGREREPTPREPVLSEVFRKAGDLPEWYPVHGGTLRSIVSGSLHYVVGSDGDEELYDLASDPRERRSLVGDPARAQDLERMRAEMAPILARPVVPQEER